MSMTVRFANATRIIASTPKTRVARSYYESDPEIRLWRSVVLQALSDIAIGTDLNRDDAVSWLSRNDCREVCDRAELAHAAVQSIGLDLLALPTRTERLWLMRRVRERVGD